MACATPADNPIGGASVRAARDTVLIDGTAQSCTSCTLTIADSVVIGSPNDRDIPQRIPNYILRDSRGTHYLIFNGWVNKPILRYDSAGHYLGKLGAYGKGPGEYTMTGAAFLGTADSVFVFDLGSRKGRVYSNDGAYVRTPPLADRPVIAAVPDGSGDLYGFARTRDFSVLLARDSRDSNPTTPHLVRFGADGTLRDSFPVFQAPMGAALIRNGATYREVQLSPATAHPVIGRDGSIWTHTGGNYRLEQHSPDGASRKLIGVSLPERETPIMTVADAESLVVQRQRAGPIGTRTTGDENRPFLPARVFVQVDSTGLIWVMRLQRAPDADTIKVAYEYLSPDEAPEERSIPRNTEDRMFRTIVEVIDPSRGELIARHELPFLGVLTAPGYVGRVRIDDSGHYVVKVYRLALTR